MIWTIEDQRESARRYYHNRKKRLGDEFVFAERKERNKKSRMRRQADWLRYEAKGRAKRRGLEYSLTKEDIIIPSHCPILGIEIRKNEGQRGPNDNSPTIDRIDNNKGYTKDNIKIISWRANRIKNNASLEELKAVVKYIEDHLKETGD